MGFPVAFIIGALSAIPGFYFLDTSTSRIYDHLDLCVEKILSCNYYRQSFSLYEKDIGMFPNIEDLKKACKRQVPYMRCIARAERFCEETLHSHVAQEMINSRSFPTGICRPPSPWQQVYLREASCLNTHSKKGLAYCINKKIGFIRLKNVKSLKLRCRHVKDIIDCSASRVQEKCGYYAGYILKSFLKFHSLSDYKCIGFKVDGMEDNSLSSTPNYDIIEAIFNISEHPTSAPTEATVTMANTNIVEIEPDRLEDHVSDHTLTEEPTTISELNYLVPEEFLEKPENSFSESFGFQMKTENDKLGRPDFPTLPKRHYMLKNRTTFTLYEDLQMGHMKYIGCGEADIFWVILSPLVNKYCTLMDLKSEYSESIFKCSIRVDAPCSAELDDEDKSKNAEVFHRRYVLTVLTPPNNQRAEDMAVMHVHYLKVYPSTSTHVPEEKINLWTDQANELPFQETEHVDRKGPFERENDNDILYRHSNGSGQIKDTDSRKNSHNLDEVEHYEEYENWDYYPLDRDDDIFGSKLLSNDIIYIEDVNGELISLHDQRSPIFSKSQYQPHSLFRPRIGTISSATDPNDDDKINRKKKLAESSKSEERASKLKDKISISKANSNQKEHCSAEMPCPLNSETISNFEVKPGMHIDYTNIKTFDPFKGLDEKIPLQIQSPYDFKLEDDIDEELYKRSRSAYVVTPSTKIELPKSVESRRPKKHINEFVTDRSRYPLEELCGTRKDRDDFSLESDCSTTVKSVPYSDESKIDYLKSFDDYYTYEITQGPYDYLTRYPDTKANLEFTIDTIETEAESSSKNDLEWKKDFLKIFGKFLKVLYKGAKIVLYDKYYI